MTYHDILKTMYNIMIEAHTKDHNFDCTKYTWFIPCKVFTIFKKEFDELTYCHQPFKSIMGCEVIVCDVDDDVIYLGKRYGITKARPITIYV